MDALSAKAVLLQEIYRGPGFGLDLLGRVSVVTGGAVTLSEGSVYTALRDLERDGLIVSAGVESRGDRGGRPRQLYRITETGQRIAEAHRAVVLALFGGGTAERRRDRCGAEADPGTPAERWVETDGDDKLLPAE